MRFPFVWKGHKNWYSQFNLVFEKISSAIKNSAQSLGKQTYAIEGSDI